MKTPVTIITGSLGSGKTTLLRNILTHPERKIAVLMNEFGEIAIDSKIIQGENIEIAELEGGCVCCSLIGEFEQAVVEMIERVAPECIVVETTGVAEPDAMIIDIEENLPMVRLDGIVTIVDADLMIRFPELGRTTEMQIEDADLLVLNKSDLVSEEECAAISQRLRKINKQAPILKTSYCAIPSELLFGISRARELQKSPPAHHVDYQSFAVKCPNVLNRDVFLTLLHSFSLDIMRIKGFVNFADGIYLLNYVAGRWDIEPYPDQECVLVFIGKNLKKEQLAGKIKQCEEA